MRRVVFCCVFVTIGLGLKFAGSQDPKPVAKVMRQKLEHSQKVLEGITLENYSTITKSAKELHSLGRAASWRARPTPEYSLYSAEFLRLTEKLGKMAQDKNLDGATLAYLELTMNCVNCHKHVRTIGTASLDSQLRRTVNGAVLAKTGDRSSQDGT